MRRAAAGGLRTPYSKKMPVALLCRRGFEETSLSGMRLNRIARRGLITLLSCVAGQASSFLPTGSLTCMFTNFGFNDNCMNSPNVGADFALPAGSDGITGVGFWLTSPVTDFESSVNGTHTFNLTFTTTGQLTGSGGTPAGTIIPLEWDFNLGMNTGAFGRTGTFAGGAWTVSFDIKNGATSIFGSAPTFTGANAASVSGTGSAVTTLPFVVGTTYTVTATLTDTWTRTAGTPGLVVGVPKSSLDVNFVPEPGTLAGTGGALVLLSMALRRARRSR
jgi:hypothetical protein